MFHVCILINIKNNFFKSTKLDTNLDIKFDTKLDTIFKSTKLDTKIHFTMPKYILVHEFWLVLIANDYQLYMLETKFNLQILILKLGKQKSLLEQKDQLEILQLFIKEFKMFYTLLRQPCLSKMAFRKSKWLSAWSHYYLIYQYIYRLFWSRFYFIYTNFVVPRVVLKFSTGTKYFL